MDRGSFKFLKLGDSILNIYMDDKEHVWIYKLKHICTCECMFTYFSFSFKKWESAQLAHLLSYRLAPAWQGVKPIYKPGLAKVRLTG